MPTAAPPEARRLAGHALADALRESRATTLACVAGLGDTAWATVPQQTGANPIAWELGHLAWFAEFWILRGPHTLRDSGFVDAAKPARIAGPDALYDSARLVHAERWHPSWPERAAVLATLAAQLEACIEAIPAGEDASDEALYFHRLALFHEDMHAEAFTALRAALGWPAPAGLGLARALAPAPRREPLAVAASRATIGWPASRRGFAFDNEAASHAVALAAYEIDSAPVDNASFLAYVEATGAPPPKHWRRHAGAWQERWFDSWQPLEPRRPVVHVSAFEAEAFCRWAERRLPHAAEWEHAAQSAPGFVWGHSVWEWTADAFRPAPGFVPGPYRDYSQPWFSDHRELRGGSFATHARMHHPLYRNFYTPDRIDVFAGFRTCASND